MVARPGVYQASFNGGELSPDVAGNTGLKNYYNGLSLAVNVEPVPQGGFDLPPRTRHRGYVRRALSVAYSGVAASASMTGAGVVASWVFPTAVQLACVDLAGLTATPDLPERTLVVEALVGAAWVQIGCALAATATGKARRLGVAPGEAIEAASLRLRLTAAPAAATVVAVASVIVRSEAAAGVPSAQMLPFSASRAASFMAVLTTGHIDIWDGGAWVGCSAAPYGAADVGRVKGPQRDETAILFHPDFAPRRLVYHADPADWSLDSAPLTHIPDVDYGGVYVDVAEKWTIYLQWVSEINVTSVSFVVGVDGQETPSIDVVTDWSETAAAVQAALLDLPNVEPGLTVTDGGVVGGGGYSRKLFVTFAGDGNKGQSFDLSARIVAQQKASVQTARDRKGKKGGEAIMSASRGWPGCGCFYQQRLFAGGFRSKGSAALASRSGEYFDMNVELENAAGAILANLDTDGAETIMHFAQGRHLCLFTDVGEFYIADRALDRTKPLNVVSSSRIGAHPDIPVVEQEGSLLFVSGGSNLVYASTYNDMAQAYVSEPVTLLASHLFDQVTGAALQRAATATDAQRYWLPRADGVMVLGLLIRGQDVTAFVRWQTDGAVRRIAVDAANLPYVLVERQIGGAARLCVETLHDGLLLDAAVSQAFAAPQTLVAGLAHLEGATVWALADGYSEGPFTVAGGSITLPTASRDVTVGRWVAPRARTMPLARDVGQRTVLKRPARVHTVQLDLMETTSLAVGANGLPVRDVALARMGDPAEGPTPPYSGQKVVSGLVGFSDDGVVEITQTRPGHLRVRDLTIQARV